MHYRYYSGLVRSLPYGIVRRITGKTCRNYAIIESFVREKEGLEIGGPSPIFRKRRLVPVYDRCRTIDLCNFSSQTIWNSPADRLEPAIPLGKQFVAEATDLSSISGRKYDFILASHVLEHIANPLRALEEWQRTLRPNGILLIIVPDKRRTFDHQRPFTTFKHIEADFQNDTPETDLTHLEEILALHDLALDPNAGDASQFRNRCFMNFKVRAMHHHVFTPELLRRMLERVYMKVLSVGIERPHHIIGLAQSNSYQ